MHSRVRTAIVLLTFAGLAGIWLVLAPFVSGYQPVGDPWITPTIHHVATGTVLAVVSFAAVLTVLGGALRSLDGMLDATTGASDPNHPRAPGPHRHEEGTPWTRG